MVQPFEPGPMWMAVSQLVRCAPAALECRVVPRQCLTRQIAEEDMLRGEITTRESRRNSTKDTSGWHFSITDVRAQLKRLYSATSMR
jgi:hypothetical protein